MRLFHRLALVRPSIRAGIVVAVALFAGIFTFRVTADAEAARDRLGRTTEVLILRHDIDAGSAIGPGDVVAANVPDVLVPDGALSRLPDGSVARTDLHAREVVVTARLLRGRPGPAARIPDGWRGVAIPTAGVPLPVQVGDVVDVVASFDTAFVETGDPTIVVAEAAVVIHVGDDAITVAVAADRVVAVAESLVSAVVTLTLAG